MLHTRHMHRHVCRDWVETVVSQSIVTTDANWDRVKPIHWTESLVKPKPRKQCTCVRWQRTSTDSILIVFRVTDTHHFGVGRIVETRLRTIARTRMTGRTTTSDRCRRTSYADKILSQLLHLKLLLPISPLSLDSVIEGVPSVCVGVDVPMLWGGVHVTERKVEPRPDDVPLEMLPVTLLVTLPVALVSVSPNAICDTL